jgi:hypothetical protein
MSSVVGFWWFPEEEAPFLEFLHKQGPLVGTRNGVVHEQSEIVISDFDQLIAEDARYLLIAPAPFAEALSIAQGHRDDGPWLAPSEPRSPFISYRRGYVAGVPVCSEVTHPFALKLTTPAERNWLGGA